MALWMKSPSHRCARLQRLSHTAHGAHGAHGEVSSGSHGRFRAHGSPMVNPQKIPNQNWAEISTGFDVAVSLGVDIMPGVLAGVFLMFSFELMNKPQSEQLMGRNDPKNEGLIWWVTPNDFKNSGSPTWRCISSDDQTLCRNKPAAAPNQLPQVSRGRGW